MTTIQAPRGTRDILPQDQVLWEHLVDFCKLRANQFGYLPITIPTFEETGLFERSIGESTDILEKELFIVSNRNSAESDRYALRPEATAGIVRAFVEHGLHTLPQPVKLYNILNNFRYERPQKGRYRELWQFDLEIIGEKSPLADCWCILTGYQLFQSLGLTEVELQLNSLGLLEERTEFLSALRDYLEPRKDQLSEDSKRRLDSNPLRILDSKDPQDQALLKDAPKLLDFFGPVSQSHFEQVKKTLDLWKIPYHLNPHLVRGLDYYCHTTFEWYLPGEGGSQSALGGGGRYDGLLPQLNGPDLGAVGQALGLDRIFNALDAKGYKLAHTNNPELFLIPADEAGLQHILQILPELTWLTNPRVDWSFEKVGVGNLLKKALKLEAEAVLIIGSAEIEKGKYQLKWLQTGEQEEVTLDELKAKF